jgi:hypothetical protein
MPTGREGTLDQQLSEIVTNMSIKQKERALKKLLVIQKKRTPAPKPKSSPCRPQTEPVSWKPKDTTTSQQVLEYVIGGVVGVVRSNILGNAWQNKLMASELARCAVGSISADQARSTVAKTSMLVTALLARVFEIASEIKEREKLEEPEFEMHHHRCAAGFARSRGSGLACNESGLALLRRAATELRSKLEQES